MFIIRKYIFKVKVKHFSFIKFFRPLQENAQKNINNNLIKF